MNIDKKSVSLSLFTICGILLCCGILTGDDDKLTLSRQDYNGSELKLEGYYYSSSGHPGKIKIHFLFRNGILLGSNEVWDQTKIVEVEKEFSDGRYYERIKNNKQYWGIFNINGNRIETQRWFETSGSTLNAYSHTGEILNDTTFRITEVKRVDGTEKREIDYLFHWQDFSPKPDSTCSFIP